MQGLRLTADLHHCQRDPRSVTDAALQMAARTVLFEPAHVEQHQLTRGEITA